MTYEFKLFERHAPYYEYSQLVIFLRKEGYKLREIAEITHTTKQNIHSILKYHSVDPPTDTPV